MAEFFIVRGCRRRSVGTRAAAAIWNRFPGRWEVRVRGRNEKAREFWGEAIRDFTGKTAQSTPFEMDSTDWHLFSFESQAKA
jgi:predicted acetyltransferase